MTLPGHLSDAFLTFTKRWFLSSNSLFVVLDVWGFCLEYVWKRSALKSYKDSARWDVIWFSKRLKLTFHEAAPEIGACLTLPHKLGQFKYFWCFSVRREWRHWSSLNKCLRLLPACSFWDLWRPGELLRDTGDNIQSQIFEECYSLDTLLHKGWTPVT